MRVLIVDDEEYDVVLLQAMLQDVEGVVTVATTDPRHAPELFSVHQPDLVMLDLNLGDVDGVDLMETLRELS